MSEPTSPHTPPPNPTDPDTTDALAVLLDGGPLCVIGHDPVSRSYGHRRCDQEAVWAFRTHDGMGDEGPTGVCPSVVLVCTDHRLLLTDLAERNILYRRRKGRMVVCGACGLGIRSLEDAMWGVERIAP